MPTPIWTKYKTKRYHMVNALKLALIRETWVNYRSKIAKLRRGWLRNHKFSSLNAQIWCNAKFQWEERWAKGRKIKYPTT